MDHSSATSRAPRPDRLPWRVQSARSAGCGPSRPASRVHRLPVGLVVSTVLPSLFSLRSVMHLLSHGTPPRQLRFHAKLSQVFVVQKFGAGWRCFSCFVASHLPGQTVGDVARSEK